VDIVDRLAATRRIRAWKIVPGPPQSREGDMKRVFGAAIIGLIASSGAAAAADYSVVYGDIYLPKTVSESGVSVKSSTGFGATAGLGWQFGDHVRFEPTISYARININDVRVLGVSVPVSGGTNAVAGMASLYYHPLTDVSVSPYIGGGIGVLHVWGSASAPGVGTVSASSTDFAFHGSAGLAIAVTERSALLAGYRHVRTTDAGSGNNVISIGLMTSF
jgi:opacity protein-like surface antigen